MDPVAGNPFLKKLYLDKRAELYSSMAEFNPSYVRRPKESYISDITKELEIIFFFFGFSFLDIISFALIKGMHSLKY